MKKTAGILLDHRSLIAFCFFGILYVLVPWKLYGGPANQVLQAVCIVWTGIILVHDLIAKRIKLDPLMIALSVFYAWSVISFIFQPKGHGIYPFIHLLEMVMFIGVFIPASRTLSAEQVHRFTEIIAWMVIVIITVMNIIAVAFFYLHEQLPFPELIVRLYTSFGVRNGHPRYPGGYKHPVLAGEKCIAAILCCLLLQSRKKIRPAAAAVIYISSLWMILLADSRTADIQLILIALFLCALHCLGNRKRMRIFAGVLAVLAVGFCILVYIKLSRNTGPLFDRLNRISSNRLIIWKTSLAEFLKRPVLGWGWENGDAIAQYTQAEIYDSHNLAVNLLLWTGLPGFGAFFAAVIVWIRRLLKNKGILHDGVYRWYILITAMFFVQSLLDILIIGDDIRLGTPMFWLFAGIVYYYRKTSMENQ